MRTIQYRGQKDDLSNMKWLYGSLIQKPAVMHEGFDCFIGYIEDGKWHESQVLKGSIGHFIGLCDKNGVKIFEGDKFQVANNRTYEVRWLNGTSNHELYTACFGLYLNEDVFFPFDEYALKHGVVIGNIHEGGEL